MKIIIAGYDKMLAALINGVMDNGHEVVGVIRADRVRYDFFTLFFKDIFAPSKDISYIKSKKLSEIKTKSVNTKKFRDEIVKRGADLVLVGSWGEKFSNETLDIPKYGVINCHPSLLPKHRGANPYFWQIYSNDEKAGVTFHFMNEKYDSGEILMQASFDIMPYMTGGSLKTKACKVAEIMLKELLDDLEQNMIIPVKQDETEATYDKYDESLRLIDFNYEPPLCLHNKVRGLRPFVYPIAVYKERIYKVKHSELKLEKNKVKGKYELKKEGRYLFAFYKDCTLKLTLL